jgi:hypothetical protein
MYVEKGKENRDAYTFFTEILILLNLFNIDHLAISRRYNQRIIYNRLTNGNSEKTHHEKRQKKSDTRYNPIDNRIFTKNKTESGNYRPNQEIEDYNGMAFFVNSHK